MLLHESANMEQSVPENLSTHVFSDCEMKLQVPTRDPVDVSENGCNSNSDLPTKDTVSTPSPATSVINSNTSVTSSNSSTTKVKLSFSVDRLLSAERTNPSTSLSPTSSRQQCCDGSVFACCTFPSCFTHSTEAANHATVSAPPQVLTNTHAYAYAGLDKFYPGLYMDYKSVLRPTPIRAAEHATFPTLATNALMRFHQQQQHHQQHQQQQQHLHPQHQHQHKAATLLNSTTSALNGLKTLQLTQQQRFLAKSAQQQMLDIPITATGAAGTSQNGGHTHSNNNSSNNNGSNSGGNNMNGSNSSSNNNSGKRKRSWSRAVFTNLQRKGLEIQFQQQKYITKPDRRKLAARLNLTDAQVKVWFQNRRMKWRHTRENLKSGHEKQPTQQNNGAGNGTGAAKQPLLIATGIVAARLHEPLEYSSDSCSSVDLSERADDDDNIEIDVVE
ncbi:homeobox protein H2.0 [Drosophila grimshawi]|uniref:GH10711 n=1 Tax=Drosophila grimshawi TaxID=7222 RepID=B4JC26_DROGR|nr:homeobox protein H2.0 [Drosophila grimshawi]EDW03039.1 GH10711 [Drosophila grimshawi]